MTVKSLTEKDAKNGIIEAENVIKNQRDETAVVYITKILAGRRK